MWVTQGSMIGQAGLDMVVEVVMVDEEVFWGELVDVLLPVFWSKLLVLVPAC